GAHLAIVPPSPHPVAGSAVSGPLTGLRPLCSHRLGMARRGYTYWPSEQPVREIPIRLVPA
ncbi:MAG: hypothetical protein VKJ09_07840, partial [Leptolyngbya sp.]|nr:hypothetical protein [Leptolyngbya sp.]